MTDHFANGDVVKGKYRIERVIGEGAMGIVLEAYDVALDRRVAIKVLQPEMAAHPQSAARFIREARTAAKIRSEHVCRVLDVDRLEDGAPFMVMELLEGRDLGSVVEERGGRLPASEVAEFLLQACEAIAEAHAHGIVHRDLKPENLFLTTRPDGTTLVKVLDFGISKGPLGPQGVELTAPGSAVGSPLYMSPEQMRASPDVDARSDIWGLGAILYELLSGSPPFPGQTLPEVAALVLTTDAAPVSTLRPDVDPGLGAIVARCLQRDVAHRYEDVGELAADLAQYAGPRSQVHVERILRTLSVALESALSGGPSVLARSGSSVVGSEARASALPSTGGGRAVFKVGLGPVSARAPGDSEAAAPGVAAASGVADPPRAPHGRGVWLVAAIVASVVVLAGAALALRSTSPAAGVAVSAAPPSSAVPGAPVDSREPSEANASSGPARGSSAPTASEPSVAPAPVPEAAASVPSPSTVPPAVPHRPAAPPATRTPRAPVAPPSFEDFGGRK